MLTSLSQTLLQWQHSFSDLGWLGIVAFALMAFVLQIFGVPLAPFGIMAGLFFGTVDGFIAIHLGTNLGAALNFLVARYFLRERIARWLQGHEKFQVIDEAIGREGWKIIALLRLCPIPFGIANYSYGLTAVGFFPYLVATFFAIIPANFFFAWFGATSHDALGVLTGQAKATPGQTAFTVVGLVAFFVVLTYITKVARAAVARGGPRPANS